MEDSVGGFSFASDSEAESFYKSVIKCIELINELDFFPTVKGTGSFILYPK